MNEYLQKFQKAPEGFDYSASIDTYWASRWGRRREWVGQYAWAVPSDEAIEAIARHSPLVEIGAGTGYWAYLLQQAGADVVAYDIKPPPKTWTEVRRGNPWKVHKHQDRALFLCWPDYNGAMAYRCLKHYKGQTVIYIGEGEGGCTGDDRFHRLLGKRFRFDWDDVIEIPQYTGIHDALWICPRRAA